MSEVLIIAIVGPTCSGKTTVSKLIQKAFGSNCSIISQDNYYYGGNKNTNYDVPDAIDFALLTQHIKQLKKGKTVKIPQYDFKTHSRRDEYILFKAKKIIIIEGILIYCYPELLDLIDIKIYIKSNPDVRKRRRIKRDVDERGRDVDEVVTRYERDVEPSNQKYVEPSQKHANKLLIDNCDYTFDGMDKVLTEIYKKIGLVNYCYA